MFESVVNSVKAKSNTIEVNGDQLFKSKKSTENVDVRAYGHLEETTGAVHSLRLKNQSPFISTVLDVAATLFTPETPSA